MSFEKVRILGLHNNIFVVYLDDAPALPTVKKQYGRFRNQDCTLENQPLSGELHGVEDDIVTISVKENPRTTTEEIATRLKMDNSTEFRCLNKLGYVSSLNKWVPHKLTKLNKLDRINVAISHLARYKKDAFLKRLVTGNEK